MTNLKLPHGTFYYTAFYPSLLVEQMGVDFRLFFLFQGSDYTTLLS